LTYAKTIGLMREMKRLGMKNGLVHSMMQYGTMYYLVRVLLIVVSVSVQMANTVPSAVRLVMPGFEIAISHIVINRLLLDLRRVAHGRNDASTASVTLPELAFVSNGIIGNLGAPLRIGDRRESAAEDGEMEVEHKRPVGLRPTGSHSDSEILVPCEIFGSSSVQTFA